MPNLILNALQVNIRAFPLPEPEADGALLGIPMDALEGLVWQ